MFTLALLWDNQVFPTCSLSEHKLGARYPRGAR